MNITFILHALWIVYKQQLIIFMKIFSISNTYVTTIREHRYKIPVEFYETNVKKKKDPYTSSLISPLFTTTMLSRTIESLRKRKITASYGCTIQREREKHQSNRRKMAKQASSLCLSFDLERVRKARSLHKQSRRAS